MTSLTCRAPTDCLQYFTGASGNIQSFNYPNQIMEDLDYASCIRQVRKWQP